MPEYLAPGVYVEETSFRAKSIEGVGTSTTAFAGPTRRGPLDEIPELVTSFPDFERIYGGLGDLYGMPNYLAHAVRAYFNEGGSRLYVSRVYASGAADGRARSEPVVASADPAERASFVARFPGTAGNGSITLRQIATPATPQTMDSAPVGSLLRLGGEAPATPARLEGRAPPYGVDDGDELRLELDGAAVTVVFRGRPAEAMAADPLADPLTLAGGDDRTLRVTLDGVEQAITLPAGDHTPDEVESAVNVQLRDGYARLTDANRLVIGGDRRGVGASIRVEANALFGFSSAVVPAPNPADANNNVGDLGALTPGELDTLLQPQGVRATLSPSTGRLVLSTVDTGAGATLRVLGGDGSAHGALGLTPTDDPVTGGDGPDLEYYVKAATGWEDSAGDALALPDDLDPGDEPEGGADFVTLAVDARDADGGQNLFEGLGFHPLHPRYVGAVMALTPARRADHLELIFAVEIGAGVSVFELRDGIFAAADEQTVLLSGGGDGAVPGQAAYEAALTQLEGLDDVSIVAAPGHTALAGWQGIQGALISHVSRRRAYRIAVLDTPPGQTVGEARRVRARIDSNYAAIYFPWVTVANPLARPGVERIPREIGLPPSGFVCGIYARNDVERGVHKAPANEVVRGALRFETDINFAQQEVLNPIGVNCLRFFPGRGYRVWGARLASSDPEWKYVNVRRYFVYLERSIDVGTQWAVFEPNGERLWANIRETVASFLYNEWRNGALLGGSPKEAYFVRCDRTTMTQNDLDNGRLVCLVGVAVLKPAEFVIFRIGQKTADARE